MANTKKLELPKRCFVRGHVVWIRYKDEHGAWVNKSTEYTVDEVLGNPDVLARYVRSRLAGVASRTAKVADGERPANTLREYIKVWLADREARGIAAAKYDEPARLERVNELLGDIRLTDIRPKHAQELVRHLRSLKGAEKLAPRTIIHIYRTLHNVFESAVVDELVMANPIKVKKGELPKKVDADPEWRSKATYTVREVERLISDSIIPVERRVQYALKAIAGLRHQEVAALCWRHLDHNAEPLSRINIVQAYDSRERQVKSTKSEETREVPMHPTLAKILAAWKLEHWERIYGRKPTDDDFVVPTRLFTCVNVADAGHAMQDDLGAIGLRQEAGKKRKRGGHDLRGWFETRCIEDGGDSKIIDRMLHASDKSVSGGYQRFSWNVLCREVGKLKVSTLDGKVLPLVTESLQGELQARNRWRSKVTPKGLEPFSNSSVIADSDRILDEKFGDSRSDDATRGDAVTRGVRYMRTAADMLERAIRKGDTGRAMRILREIRADAGDTVLALVK